MSENLLLDTVTFVEFLQGTLPASIRLLVEQSHRRFLSVITPWEIQMKRVLRERIRPMDVTAAIEQMGLEIRTVLLDHLWLLWQMPEFPEHCDPFDRLLIAQALTHDLTVITRDRRFALYPQLVLIEY